MNIINKSKSAAMILIALFTLTGSLAFSYPTNEESMLMFSTNQPTQSNNLAGVDFNERNAIEAIADDQIKAATDPYAASLPLIASAELGDAKRYNTARTLMLTTLKALDDKPAEFAEWMRSDAFKAWMWGRVLLSAKSMGDSETIFRYQAKLTLLLTKPKTKESGLAFYTWAQAYNAALNMKQYRRFENAMMENAILLSKKAKENPSDHSALSDALWAWVMNLSAAANAKDKEIYSLIKENIKALTGAESVTKSLELGLLRTAESNDYPAWAMAKVRLAAAMMRDNATYQDMEAALNTSINGSNQAGAKAEYSLSVLENQLSIKQYNTNQLKQNNATSQMKVRAKL